MTVSSNSMDTQTCCFCSKVSFLLNVFAIIILAVIGSGNPQLWGFSRCKRKIEVTSIWTLATLMVRHHQLPGLQTIWNFASIIWLLTCEIRVWKTFPVGFCHGLKPPKVAALSLTWAYYFDENRIMVPPILPEAWWKTISQCQWRISVYSIV